MIDKVPGFICGREFHNRIKTVATGLGMTLVDDRILFENYEYIIARVCPCLRSHFGGDYSGGHYARLIRLNGHGPELVLESRIDWDVVNYTDGGCDSGQNKEKKETVLYLEDKLGRTVFDLIASNFKARRAA